MVKNMCLVKVKQASHAFFIFLFGLCICVFVYLCICVFVYFFICVFVYFFICVETAYAKAGILVSQNCCPYWESDLF